MFTGIDVLRRAEAIITSGPLPADYSEHGPWCIWCAIAMAKSQLDREYKSGLSISELFEDVALGMQERESDWPLLEAKLALDSAKGIDLYSLTQDRSLQIVRDARNHLHPDKTASNSAE